MGELQKEITLIIYHIYNYLWVILDLNQWPPACKTNHLHIYVIYDPILVNFQLNSLKFIIYFIYVISFWCISGVP